MYVGQDFYALIAWLAQYVRVEQRFPSWQWSDLANVLSSCVIKTWVLLRSSKKGVHTFFRGSLFEALIMQRVPISGERISRPCACVDPLHTTSGSLPVHLYLITCISKRNIQRIREWLSNSNLAYCLQIKGAYKWLQL